MWSGHSSPLPLTFLCPRKVREGHFEKADWERAALKGSSVEGHDFSRAVKPLKSSRASAPAVATLCFAYMQVPHRNSAWRNAQPSWVPQDQ
jgi:hypothetical protein